MENRRHQRVPLRRRAEISCRSEDSVVTETVYLTDISLGGARVSAGHSFAPLSIVKLEIDLPAGNVTLIGSVRYVAEQSGPLPFELGIKFIGLDDEELDRLRSTLLGTEASSDEKS